MVRQTISWTNCFQWDENSQIQFGGEWKSEIKTSAEHSFVCSCHLQLVLHTVYIFVNTFTFICLWKVKYKRCMPSIDPYKIPSFNLWPSFGAQWENKRNNQSTAHHECANSSILNAINLFGLILGWHAIYIAKMRDGTKIITKNPNKIQQKQLQNADPNKKNM